MKIDQSVGLVGVLGLAFLLFLAGLEVDLKVTTIAPPTGKPVTDCRPVQEWVAM